MPSAGRDGAGPEEDRRRSSAWSGGRYAGVSLATAGLVVAAAASVGWEAGPAAAGALAAWGVQIASFRPLWHRIRSGRRAVGAWVGGIAVRLAGLGVLGGIDLLTAADVTEAAVAYGVTITLLLWLEAVWLARGGKTAETTTTELQGS